MRPYLLVMASLVFFAIGESASKAWANHQRWWLVFVMLLSYCIGSIVWLPAIKEHNHLTSLGTFWNMGAMVITVLVGACAFGEVVSARQWVGIVLALIACWLVS
jgi:drug/metabolite transporter (DMT)-like permease